MLSTTTEWLHFLDSSANPHYALPMKKYMKDKFYFLGIKTPDRRNLLTQWIKENPIPSLPDLQQLVIEMWNSPYREYHYCALDMLDKKRKQLNASHVELLEYLIVTHAWWDTVDLISSHLVGELFSKHPELVETINERWMKSNNLWLQRTCLLYQLGYREKTNLDLLQKNILRLKGEKDFFIRKAIGWALRQYAKTDAGWVRKFVMEHELSPLSRKEALKNIG
ncbi:MAG: DNA alkylation repair protein [Bacteroidales bacterium]